MGRFTYNGGMSLNSTVKDLAGRLERFQASRPWLAFPYAVFRKFGEDQTNNYAALIAYYGFLSLFPLLLVLVSILEIVLAGNGHLQNQILTNATNEFPTFGNQLRAGLHHGVHGNGLGLAIGIILTLIGARGVAQVIADALNHQWRVPFDERPGFPINALYSLGMIVVMGVSIIATTALTALGGYGIAAALVVNMGAFLLVFRLGISKVIKTRDLINSAITAAIFWQLLQTFGRFLIAHELKNFNGVYGTFAVVLGLLWWLFIQAEVTLLAVQIRVVRALKLWPRSLTEPPLMPADKRAYTRYAVSEKRRPEQEVNVDFQE